MSEGGREGGRESEEEVLVLNFDPGCHDSIKSDVYSTSTVPKQ